MFTLRTVKWSICLLLLLYYYITLCFSGCWRVFNKPTPHYHNLSLTFTVAVMGDIVESVDHNYMSYFIVKGWSWIFAPHVSPWPSPSLSSSLHTSPIQPRLCDCTQKACSCVSTGSRQEKGARPKLSPRSGRDCSLNFITGDGKPPATSPECLNYILTNFSSRVERAERGLFLFACPFPFQSGVGRLYHTNCSVAVGLRCQGAL